MPIELTHNQRKEMLARALDAFDSWLGDISDGELADLLTGNHPGYTHMPDLGQYLEPEEQAYFESIRLEGQERAGEEEEPS